MGDGSGEWVVGSLDLGSEPAATAGSNRRRVGAID